MAKKVDPKVAKAKKQKKIVIFGGIIFVALLAFQVPRTMKMLNPPVPAAAAPAPVAAATDNAGVSLAPPTLSGSTATPTSAGTPTAPTTAGTLISFDRFDSKDPFAQQVDSAVVVPTATSDGATGANAGGESATKDGNLVLAPGGTASPTPGSGASAPPVAPVQPTTAILAVNGIEETVAVDTDFPVATPTFKLVSLTAKSAQIGIAGGSYTSGEATIKLALGKKVTLMNTADGTRYELKLVSTTSGAVPAPPVGTTSG